MPKEKLLMNPCFLSKNTCTISSSSSSSSVSSAPAAFLCLSLSESMMESTIDSAEAMIMKWNPDSPMGAQFTTMFYENKREALEFIKLVQDLQNAMHFFISRNSASKMLIQAQNLMIIAMKRLQKEFHQILLRMNHAESVSSSPLSLASMRDSTSFDDDDRVAVESISNADELSSIAMADLKAIAECMISSGYGKECLQIYKSARKSMMEEEISRLGIEKLNSSLMNKMDWDVLEIRIKNWEEAVKKAMKNLFVAERILSDHVFEMSDPFGKSCFSQITKDSALLLFSFAELVAKRKKTQEKMFIMLLLSIYKTLSDSMPEIETIFSGDFAEAIRSQARTSLNLVGASVRALLSEFESSIEKESSKSPVAGGGLHNLTLHVMSYLSPLSDFNGELTAIFADFPAQSEKLSFLKSYFDRLNSDESPSSAISTRIAWLIIVLFYKLENKTKHYNDISLSNLFLANNFDYVVSIIRTSKLKDLLGGDWITKHEAKVKKFVEKYERFAWDPVFASLPENPNATISATRATEIFGNFGHVFEETCRKESDNVVTDPKLREEIKQSIARKLIPIYRQFYHTHRARVLGDSRKVGLNVKFAPEDVGNYLSDIFAGSKEPTSTPSSSPTASPIRGNRRTF